MPQSILMPALSPTMEEGNLAKWLVSEGDTVSSGDVIAEIETDKATMEVESVEDGTIGKIIISGGTAGVKVGTQIAILLEEGEDISALEQEMSPETPKANLVHSATDTPQKEETTLSPLPSLGKNDNRIKASPLARRLASQNKLDLSAIKGTGPNNRIVKRDIDAALKKGNAQETPQKKQASVPQSMSDQEIFALYEEGSYEVLPTDGMRKIIAKRLLESKTTIPHFYLNSDVTLDALLDLRKTINARSPEGDKAYKVSVNDFIIKAMAMALQEVPESNVTWTDNSGILKHTHSDVGVAVAVEGGLFTPIIRKAETKSLVTISREMKDLAKRARNRKLMPHEYQGGTTAISNLGMFGIKNFNAIINPPHASILAVGAGVEQAIIKDKSITIGTVMQATLSVDHRAVDGALGAELLKAFKSLIEDPMALLLG